VIWLLLLLLTPMVVLSSLNMSLTALHLWRNCFRLFLMRLVFLLHLLSLILALLPFLLILLSLLAELLSPAGNKLFNFLLLDLLLILLGGLGGLELLGLSLPLDHLVSNDVDGLRVVNPRGYVVLEFCGVALPVEVGVEEHSEIPE
jgi:hypothetical protein